MNESESLLNTQLSRLIDGDVEGPTRQHILEQLRRRPELQDAWSSYHLIGDVLRREYAGQPVAEVHRRVAEQLKSEPDWLLPGPKKYRSPPPWWKPALGVGLAAGTAALTLTWMLLTPESPVEPQRAFPGNPSLATVQGPEEPPLEQSYARGVLYDESGVPVAGHSRDINRYLLNHQQWAQGVDINGIYPYASLVHYRPGR